MRILSILLLSTLLATPALAEAPSRLVTVTGEGTVQSSPDLATLSIGVTTQGDTAASALGANSAALAQVMDRLRAAGIEDRDLQTSDLSLNPNWTSDESGNSRITGYVASNQLMVRVRVLASLGAVLDAAVADGANTLNGLSFGLSDPKPLQDEARKAAVADAIARATLLVEAAGSKVGPVVSITEISGFAQPMPMFRADKAMAGAPVPTAGGEVGVTSQVSVVLEITE
ncbi:SIMPL domain-containing protein [Neotabrizicola shimadae]|uniref:SIMPL domain-containing protein n=1 Tax=Neotabrizicola shimadae TaxID=2807096 RepID=A0A8G1EDH2_9RHOB|nr:SIMPL domain-containing protein [Neotabrizicola shimadae]QYZ71532.1 SIMPL domain-containing protein [Neotabrizicola shimadae]